MNTDYILLGTLTPNNNIPDLIISAIFLDNATLKLINDSDSELRMDVD